MLSTNAKPSLAVRTPAPAKPRSSADTHPSNSPSPTSSSSSNRRNFKPTRSHSISSSSSIRFSQDLSSASGSPTSSSSSSSSSGSPQASAMARVYDSHARQPADEAQLGSVALAADGAAFVLNSEPHGLSLGQGQSQGQGQGHLDGLPLPLQDLACALGEAVERVKRVRIRVSLGPAGKRLLSGAIAGGVSRTGW